MGGLLSKLIEELVGLVGFYGAIFLSLVGYWLALETLVFLGSPRVELNEVLRTMFETTFIAEVALVTNLAKPEASRFT